MIYILFTAPFPISHAKTPDADLAAAAELFIMKGP